jgi:hypothetical protein
MYIHIYKYIYIYMHIYVCIYTYIYINVYRLETENQLSTKFLTKGTPFSRNLRGDFIHLETGLASWPDLGDGKNSHLRFR